MKKFIIEYRKEGLYLDERCIDMTKDIDVIQYIRRVHVEPQEFFLWALKHNFPLPKDVCTWLEIKQQQTEEKNIEKRQYIEHVQSIEGQHYTKMKHTEKQYCIHKEVNACLSEKELELEEKKNKLLFDQEKRDLLQTITALRKNNPVGTEEWILLRVGELALMGYGYNTILAMEPEVFYNKEKEQPFGRHWVSNRRKDFIKLIKLRYKIDPTKFLP